MKESFNTLCLFSLVYVLLVPFTIVCEEFPVEKAEVSNSWLMVAMEQIKRDEYKPTQQDEDYKGNKFQNPKLHFTNRANNLRVYIDESGIELMPRVIDDANNWNVKIKTILLISNGSSKEVKLTPEINGNVVSSFSDALDLDCLNSEEGLILSFSIKEQIDVVKLNLEKELFIIEERSKVVFRNNVEDKMTLEINEVKDNSEKKISYSYSLNSGGKELIISLENEVLDYPLSLIIKIISKSSSGNRETSHPFAKDLGLSEMPDWTVEPDQGYAYFGRSVSDAGDVNGDGYSDVIVGAPRYDNGQTNEGRAFVYYGSSSGLSTSPDWTAESDQEGAQFGHSVSNAGDVNGDGYSDVVVTAHWYDNGQTDEGRAFVYHGSPCGLSTSPDWTAESNQEGAQFGHSVSNAGDVNGDGYSDVIVGAHWYTNGQREEGGAFVYHGSSCGLSTLPDWTAESNQPGALFGYSVSDAGDVNGDGYSDVIVGAPWYANVLTNEGGAFVYHGSSSGLSTSPDWTAESNYVDAEFGFSVSNAGDVNGDGYSDVIVGAPWYTGVQTDEGRVFVYHGSSSGLSTSPDWTAESDLEETLFGSSVSDAGDVNGDGYSDVIVGAPRYDNVLTDEGRVFVYHGSSSGLSTSPDWTVESDQEYEYFGISVSTAGDVNGDGYSDVIVGSLRYTNGQTDEGGAFVYYGNSDGVALIPMQINTQPSCRPIQLLGASGNNEVLLRLRGRTPAGRGKVKLQWEIKELGHSFDETGIGESGLWYDSGVNCLDITECVSGLNNQTPYHWRVRLKFHQLYYNGSIYSRWLSIGPNGWNETDFITTPLSGIEDHKDSEGNVKLGVSPSISSKIFSISFYISEEEKSQDIRLKVYNKAGMVVKSLFTGKKDAGNHTINWQIPNNSSQSLPNGIYFISLTKGESEHLVRKVILLR